MYVAGTGDPNENLGHEVKVMLTWREPLKCFWGGYYVHTHRWEGTGIWILQLVDP
jgi:hypothetical protein